MFAAIPGGFQIVFHIVSIFISNLTLIGLEWKYCPHAMNEWTRHCGQNHQRQPAAKESALDPKCLRDRSLWYFISWFVFLRCFAPRGRILFFWAMTKLREVLFEAVCVTWITPSASSQLPSDSNTSNIWLIYLKAFANETKYQNRLQTKALQEVRVFTWCGGHKLQVVLHQTGNETF